MLVGPTVLAVALNAAGVSSGAHRSGAVHLAVDAHLNGKPIHPPSLSTTRLANGTPPTTTTLPTYSITGYTPRPPTFALQLLCIRTKESGNNYRKADGDQPDGGAYQFAISTWHGLGFTGLPSEALPSVQDAAATKDQHENGWGQWPNTSRLCGL